MTVQLEKVEKYIWYTLCGMALFSSISIAIENIFLGLSVALFLYRLYVKRDDVAEILASAKGILQPFFILAAGVFISMLFAGDLLFGLNSFWGYYIYRPIGLFIVLICCQDRERLKTIVALAMVSIAVNGGYACVQYLKLGRSGGFLPIMSMAGILSMVMPICIIGAIYFQDKLRKICGGLSILLLLFTVANNTRGAWVAIAGLVVFGVCLMMSDWKKTLTIFLIGATVLGGGLYVAKEQGWRAGTIITAKDVSSRERFFLWQSSYNMFKDHPVLGVGIGRFAKNYQEKYVLPGVKDPKLGHAHSNFFHFLAEGGVVGISTLLAFWAMISCYSVKGWLKKRNFAYLAMLCIFGGVFLQGLTEYVMGNSVVMKFHWTAIGICLQWLRLDRCI